MILETASVNPWDDRERFQVPTIHIVAFMIQLLAPDARTECWQDLKEKKRFRPWKKPEDNGNWSYDNTLLEFEPLGGK